MAWLYKCGVNMYNLVWDAPSPPHFPPRYPDTVPSLLYVTNATADISADVQQRMIPPAGALVAVASSGGDSGVSVLSPRGRYCAGQRKGSWAAKTKQKRSTAFGLSCARACVRIFCAPTAV